MLLELLDSAHASLEDGIDNDKATDKPITSKDWVFVGEYPIPRSFWVVFNFPSLVSREKLLWSCKLHMEISSEAYPRATEVIVGRVSHSAKSRFPISQKTRVEKEHLSAVSRDLRQLEAYAVALMGNTLGVIQLDDGSFEWYERGRAQEDFEDTPQDWAGLQESILKRTRNQKWDDEFLRDVARIYREAERIGEKTNVKIAEVIGARRFEKIPTKTVQKWVSEARDRGFLAKAAPNKSTAKSATREAAPRNKRSETAKSKTGKS